MLNILPALLCSWRPAKQRQGAARLAAFSLCLFVAVAAVAGLGQGAMAKAANAQEPDALGDLMREIQQESVNPMNVDALLKARESLKAQELAPMPSTQYAQEPQEPVTSLMPNFQVLEKPAGAKQGAEIRVMERVMNSHKLLKLKAGETGSFGALTVHNRGCKRTWLQTSTGRQESDIAFIDVVNPLGEMLFSGWVSL